ncbi:nucleoside triphosphate pyrophosphohydrolase [Halopseudomonas salegens]|uniref:Nucleoside triphosphate pyrophosphohydrolase n=1 Tax=Halopseudomonas salegens TaxID=1434072 RepID=A0A1H2EEW4_9GAMM|nr:nucleoside triphosphate pyrophosphohydrolase [Halopseudomonas salegens]SDT93631.1 ATP diphosphatase [Halopseudomonas salegens]
MNYRLEDLRYLMARLRDPQHGCPWDLEQDFASIVPHTLEEAYEVADAIAEADYPQLADELGDLLFQVIYYAQLAEEAGHFDWARIVDGITRKLVRRHPHVFPDGNLHTPAGSTAPLAADQVKARWEQIKAEERAAKTATPEQLSLLDDVPRALPALTRAQKLQKRAAQSGFDWPDSKGALDKLQEEVAEVQAAVVSGDQAAVVTEIGDLLFSVVNLARHLKVDAETSLRGGNEKFERRFRYIEQQLQASDKPLAECRLVELDALWEQAKRQGL